MAKTERRWIRFGLAALFTICLLTLVAAVVLDRKFSPPEHDLRDGNKLKVPSRATRLDVEE
jgi:hypothetical protein